MILFHYTYLTYVCKITYILLISIELFLGVWKTFLRTWHKECHYCSLIPIAKYVKVYNVCLDDLNFAPNLFSDYIPYGIFWPYPSSLIVNTQFFLTSLLEYNCFTIV